MHTTHAYIYECEYKENIYNKSRFHILVQSSAIQVIPNDIEAIKE